MKVSQIKQKVGAKVAKGKAKVAKKCGKAAKCAVAFIALAFVLAGCATAEAPTAQRAQTVGAEDVNVTYNVTLPALAPTNIADRIASPVPIAFSFVTEVGTATQANETSGTETMTSTPTQTPTTDVKPQTTLTYGLASPTTAGAKWIDSLDEGCAKLLSSWLGTGKANGTMEVTKKDGTRETVTCKDGVCTTSGGECIICCEDVGGTGE